MLVAVAAVLAALAAVLTPSPANAAPRKLDCDRGTNWSYCSYMTRNVENSRSYGYRDSISNSRRYAIQGHCEAATQKTFTFQLGGSVSGEVKAGIFGGVKTEVNASVARSTSTGYVTSATFRVPARDTVYCDRGTVREKLEGYTKIHRCGGGCSTETKRWSFNAPTRARWWIY